MSDTDDTEDLMHAPNVTLSVMFDTVKIELECSSAYEAQVLFDDLVERLQAGQEISIRLEPLMGKE